MPALAAAIRAGSRRYGGAKVINHIRHHLSKPSFVGKIGGPASKCENHRAEMTRFSRSELSCNIAQSRNKPIRPCNQKLYPCSAAYHVTSRELSAVRHEISALAWQKARHQLRFKGKLPLSEHGGVIIGPSHSSAEGRCEMHRAASHRRIYEMRGVVKAGEKAAHGRPSSYKIPARGECDAATAIAHLEAAPQARMAILL